MAFEINFKTISYFPGEWYGIVAYLSFSPSRFLPQIRFLRKQTQGEGDLHEGGL